MDGFEKQEFKDEIQQAYRDLLAEKEIDLNDIVIREKDLRYEVGKLIVEHELASRGKNDTVLAKLNTQIDEAKNKVIEYINLIAFKRELITKDISFLKSRII